MDRDVLAKLAARYAKRAEPVSLSWRSWILSIIR
jgi:hypothetical protein